MNSIQQQYNNCAHALRFLVNNVDSGKFDGGYFHIIDSNRSGCLVHHMWHADGELPRAIVDALEHSDGDCWGEHPFNKLLDAHYGDGAAIVLTDDACNCGYNYQEFVDIFERHTDKIKSMLTTSGGGSKRVDYEVKLESDRRAIMYNSLKDAEDDFDTLKKFGVAAELVECTSTVSRKVLRS